MSNKNWIEEYVRLLFPIDSKEIDIPKAQSLKKANTPCKLYKYRSFTDYSISSLKNSSLFLTKASELNDPFECAVNIMSDEYFFNNLKALACKTYQEKKIFNDEEISFLRSASYLEFFDFIEKRSNVFNSHNGLLEKLTSKTIKDFTQSVNEKISNKNLENILICALSETNDNSIMWSHYADEHKGFCIEYNFANFAPAPHNSWYLLNPVLYQDNIPNFSNYYSHPNFNNLISTYAAMIKAEGWKYEQEWRLILPWGPIEGKGQLIKAPTPTAIYIGYRASKDNINSLKEAIKGKNIPIYQMKRKENSFLLYAEKLGL